MNTFTTTLDTATIDQIPPKVEHDATPEPAMRALQDDAVTVLQIIDADASTWTVEQAWAAKRVLWWAASQLREVASNGEKSPVAAEEQPVDFAALRKACETLAKFRFTSFLVWTDDACAALDTLSESAPSLIAMAERCEVMRAERDRLKGRLAEVTAQHEWTRALLKSAQCGRQYWEDQSHAFEDEAAKLRVQLAEMTTSRDYAEQKVLPWRFGGESHFTGGNVLYVTVAGKVNARERGNWKWATKTPWMYTSHLMNTLPKGDAAP
jgi:hypothetical protein